MRRLVGAGKHGVYHPNLVLFGDALAEPAWSQALDTAHACDLVLQIGCSAAVWPAAGLPHEARDRGALVIVVDPQTASGDLWLKGHAADVVPRLLDLAFGASPEK